MKEKIKDYLYNECNYIFDKRLLMYILQYDVTKRVWLKKGYDYFYKEFEETYCCLSIIEYIKLYLKLRYSKFYKIMQYLFPQFNKKDFILKYY